MGRRFIIYGRSTCSFCIHAADYCVANQVEYIFLDYDHDLSFLEVCKDFFDHKTVPIILSNDLSTGATKKIGGYTDLLECMP